MSLVLDASVVVAYLTASDRAFPLGTMFERGEDLHVPTYCDVEVVSGLSRWERHRGMRGEVPELLLDYVSLPLARHDHLRLLGRMLELRRKFSAVDASYLALAESLGAAFVTLDSTLARAAREHTQLPVFP